VAPWSQRQLFDASCDGLDQFSLMARVRRVAESLHAALPGDYESNVTVLRKRTLAVMET
jgi:3-methyladenine DNA glycosylase AlkC